MKTKLWLFLISFALVFSACEKEAEFSGGLNDNGGRDIASLDECVFTVDADSIVVRPLIAGQNQPVGAVEVKLGEDDITVTYTTGSGWLLAETHLHIVADNEDEENKEKLFVNVTNRAGNPRIGNFDYGEENIFKNTWSVQIPKDDIDPDYDGCYLFAAHAVVLNITEEGGYDFDLAAFAVSLPETATIAIDHPADNLDSYFKVKVSDGDILDGTWPGWCIETNAAIEPGPPPSYDTEVFSSYEYVPGYEAEILMKINWILNKKFIQLDESGNPDYFTYGDVQIAMWTLLHGYESFDQDVRDELDATTPNPFQSSVIGPWTPAKVNEILEQVKDVTEFTPGCGDVIAIVFVHDGQDLIIEYPFPCYQDETAWGQGCLFTERGSWAMYFGVCPKPTE